MTEQEAISGLKYIYKKCDTENCKYKGQCDSCYEAVEMAISALEKQMKLKLLGFTEEVIQNYKIFEDECISKGMSFKDILEARDRQINGGWIPCSEKMPDEPDLYEFQTTHFTTWYHEWSDGNYLPKYDDYVTKIMRFDFNNNKWCMPVCCDKKCEEDTHREVIAWKPLPEPYTENK